MQEIRPYISHIPVFIYQNIVTPNTYREIASIIVRIILGMVMALMTFTVWFKDFWLLKAV